MAPAKRHLILTARAFSFVSKPRSMALSSQHWPPHYLNDTMAINTPHFLVAPTNFIIPVRPSPLPFISLSSPQELITYEVWLIWSIMHECNTIANRFKKRNVSSEICQINCTHFKRIGPLYFITPYFCMLQSSLELKQLSILIFFNADDVNKTHRNIFNSELDDIQQMKRPPFT